MHQHMIAHMSRFFCFWYSTIVSSSHLTPPFTRYPEFSNGRYSTTRNQVTGCSQDRIRTCDSLHQHIVKAETPCSSWDFYTMFRGVFLSPPDYFLAGMTGVEPAPNCVTGRHLNRLTSSPNSHFKTVEVQLVCCVVLFIVVPPGVEPDFPG